MDPLTFTVGVPFGSFEPGDTVTADAVTTRHPGADLDRLIRLGSLVPVAAVEPDAVVEGQPTPATEPEKKPARSGRKKKPEPSPVTAPELPSEDPGMGIGSATSDDTDTDLAPTEPTA